MTIERLMLFASALFTLMVAKYLAEGALRLLRGQSASLLAWGLLALPPVYVVWAQWTPWRGLSQSEVVSAVAAAVVFGGMRVAVGMLARRSEEGAFPLEEEPVGVAVVHVTSFRQAPESEYLRIAVDDNPPRIGWIAPHFDSAEERWDATLTRMGWHRATPWGPDPDGQTSCEALPQMLGTIALDVTTATGR